jgi:hypothetical protein
VGTGENCHGLSHLVIVLANDLPFISVFLGAQGDLSKLGPRLFCLSRWLYTTTSTNLSQISQIFGLSVSSGVISTCLGHHIGCSAEALPCGVVTFSTSLNWHSEHLH